MAVKEAPKVGELTSAKDVIAYARAQGLKIVDYKFVDLPGTWQHFSSPIAELEESVFADGVGFDGSSIRGFQAIHESDMLLIPDPTTAIVDPAAKTTLAGAARFSRRWNMNGLLG